MLALARTSATELVYFEFGEPLDPYPPLEERVRWILADFERRRAEFASLSITRCTGLLSDWLVEAAGDAQTLLPLIRALGFLRSANSASVLEPYLSHPSSEVRRETILALGRIGVPETLRALEPNMQSPIPALRRAAIIALGKSRDLQIFSRLEAAAGADLELQFLVRQGRRRLEAVQAKDAYAFVDAVMESEEYEDLLSVWEVAKDPVIAVLGDRTRDLVIRRRALELIAIVRVRQAGPILAAILTGERDSPEFLTDAAVAAGRCKAREAVEPLIALLDDEHPLVVEAAITSLGQIGSLAALSPLMAKWSDHAGALRARIRLAAFRLADVAGADLLIDSWQPEEIYKATSRRRCSASTFRRRMGN